MTVSVCVCIESAFSGPAFVFHHSSHLILNSIYPSLLPTSLFTILSSSLHTVLGKRCYKSKSWHWHWPHPCTVSSPSRLHCRSVLRWSKCKCFNVQVKTVCACIGWLFGSSLFFHCAGIVSTWIVVGSVAFSELSRWDAYYPIFKTCILLDDCVIFCLTNFQASANWGSYRCWSPITRMFF